MKTFWKIFFGSLLGCLVAFFVLTFIGLGFLGSIAATVKSDTTPVASSAVLKIDFKTPVVEHAASPSMSLNSLSSFNSNSISLLNTIQAIKYAATDPSIKFIFLNTDKAMLSMTAAEELRNALEQFRESGKAVIAYGTNFDGLTYYLASVADKVIMHSFGNATILGLGTNIIFFKDILDKYGVNMQLIRHGKYKAAAEQFISNRISDENYEQNKVMLDNIWSAWVSDICESRSFSPIQFNEWIDNLDLMDANSLLTNGLIDEAMYDDELQDYLCTLYDAKKFEDVNFVSIDRYARARIKSNTKAKEKIAVLYAEGDIVDEAMGVSGGPSIVGKAYVKEIQKLRQDSTVKAVVLRVSSPGGSALAAEMIRHELELLAEVKPVIASFGEYAASGGYWISAQTDKIFTDATTITGSIGVFSLVPSIEKTLEKFNLHTEFIGSNDHSTMGSLMKDLDNDEVQYFQRAIEVVYDQFTHIVSEGRNIPVETVDEIGQGRVWTGTDAVRIRLADEIGGIDKAIDYAAAIVGLEDYRLMELPVIKSQYEKLLEMMNGDSLNEIAEIYRTPATEEKHMVCARLPFVYNIKY